MREHSDAKDAIVNRSPVNLQTKSLSLRQVIDKAFIKAENQYPALAAELQQVKNIMDYELGLYGYNVDQAPTP